MKRCANPIDAILEPLFEAQQRVDDAREFLAGIDIDDERFERALEEFTGAIDRRNRAESAYA